MLKFLFGGRLAKSGQAETQRQAITRLMTDLNTTISQMPEKPKVMIDPNSGELTLMLPEQMPDEALALPAPSAVTDETDLASPAASVKAA